ncbi:MAG: glycosyltransferase [Verrucomicrobiota bacterium]
MNIVFAAHSYMNPHLVVGSHHLARNLAAMGHRVFHFSTPITLPHWLRFQGNASYRARIALWRKSGLRHSENLVEYVPLSLIPWQIAKYGGIERNLYTYFFPSLESILKKNNFGDIDALIIDEPRLVGCERHIRAKKIFYRATDLYVEMKNDRAILEAERILLNRCNGMIATSQPVLERLQSLSQNKPSLLLENGVDYEFFSLLREMPEEYAHIPSPRAVYVGALDERFNFEAIRQLAQSLPQLHVVLIGDFPVTQHHSFPSNVHILGMRPYEQAPAYMQHAQIGLLPLSEHPANQGRSPMKLYEYAAAGIPVVATATAELSRRKLDFVTLVENNADFAKAVSMSLQNPIPKETIQAHARSQNWLQKTKALLEFMESV